MSDHVADHVANPVAGHLADHFALRTAQTLHARSRMHSRSISEGAVAAVLEYGRRVHARGAVIHAIGRKEVRRYANEGVDLREYSGYQVVCSGDGKILTTYRNHDFRRMRISRSAVRGRTRARRRRAIL